MPEEIARDMFSLKISLVTAFLLPLIALTNVGIFGSQVYNETVEYKYATPEEKKSLEFKNLLYDCVVRKGSAGFETFILMLDKCKPIVGFEEKDGWRVDRIGQTRLNDLEDIKEDLIVLIDAPYLLLDKPTCVTEMFEWHVLLKDNDNCKKIVEYYLGNGWKLVEKYDQKVELIKGLNAFNSSQVNP